MKTKKYYAQPCLEKIIIDKEVSLALESAPPEGPDETKNSMPMHIDINPYKNQQA